MSVKQEAIEGEQAVGELEAVLAYHGGDARKAIATLLEDCRYLRQELALAEGCSSVGFSRGWRPNFERPTG